MKKFAKRVLKTWRVIVRCSLIIATIVAMLFVTINVGKVFVTQVRLASIYRSIDSSEAARDESATAAQTYENVYARRAYQNQADNYDAEVERLIAKRSEIMHSSDKIVAWAAKDGFEHSIFWPALLAMIIVLAAWWLGYKHLTPIIDVEEKIFNGMVYVLFIGAYVFFMFMGKCCYCIARVHKNKKITKKRPSNVAPNNVVSFDRKKRLG